MTNHAKTMLENLKGKSFMLLHDALRRIENSTEQARLTDINIIDTCNILDCTVNYKNVTIANIQIMRENNTKYTICKVEVL